MLSTKLTTGAARRWVGALAVASSLVLVSGEVSAQAEQQDLVNKSEATFTAFMRDPDMTWLQRHIGDAEWDDGNLVTERTLDFPLHLRGVVRRGRINQHEHTAGAQRGGERGRIVHALGNVTWRNPAAHAVCLKRRAHCIGPRPVLG